MILSNNLLLETCVINMRQDEKNNVFYKVKTYTVFCLTFTVVLYHTD